MLKPVVDGHAEQNSCTAKLALKIADPTATAGLDTRQIAVTEGSNKLNYYQNVRWSSTASSMLSSILEDDFEQSKIFASVSTDVDGLNSDLSLLTDIRNFEVTDKATGAIKIRIMAKLINTKTRDLVDEVNVEKTATPPANKIDDIVTTFNQLTQASADEIKVHIKGAKQLCVNTELNPSLRGATATRQPKK